MVAVNSHAAPLSDHALVDVRDRALRATSVPIALLDATESDLPVVWVNDAFERVTGYGLDEARRRHADVLRDNALPSADVERLRRAVHAQETVVQTLILRRADGSPFACRVPLSPVPESDGGALSHWVAALQDLTEQLSHDAEQAALVEAERRERRSLGLIAQVSDLLMDVDDPHALREIAAVLRRAVVGWAAFYLNDGGLRVADGIDVPHAPTGKGSRHGEGPAARDAGPDVVQQLLDGELDRPVELELDGSYGSGSASAWLVHQAGPTSGTPRAPPSTVWPCSR